MGYAYLFIFIILVHEMFLYESYVNDDDDSKTAPMFDRFIQVNSIVKNSVLA